MTTSTDCSPSRRAAEFVVEGSTVRGWLQTPPGAGPFPLVILAHGMGGLKEWTIPEVADALVARGIAALAFDYRHFGDSDGAPREEIDHCGQVEDFRSAITFGALQPEIDAGRIGLWGTSLGGRNVLATAALDRRVRCVLAQVPACSSLAAARFFAAALVGGDPAQLKQIMAEDRRERALGRPPRYVEFDTGPGTEHYDYWSTFGDEERRNWTPHMTLRSLEPTPVTDVRPLMPEISPTPLRMIVTENDFMYAGQMEAYAAALEPKSLVVLPGNHYAAYTMAKTEAIAATCEWFVEHLL